MKSGGCTERGNTEERIGTQRRAGTTAEQLRSLEDKENALKRELQMLSTMSASEEERASPMGLPSFECNFGPMYRVLTQSMIESLGPQREALQKLQMLETLCKEQQEQIKGLRDQISALKFQVQVMEGEMSVRKEESLKMKSETRTISNAISSLLQENSSFKSERDQLATDLENFRETLAEMRQAYFYVLVASVKLELSSRGVEVDLKADTLYEMLAADRRIHSYTEWGPWIYKNLSKKR